jgi:hypothetical protein
MTRHGGAATVAALLLLVVSLVQPVATDAQQAS